MLHTQMHQWPLLRIPLFRFQLRISLTVERWLKLLKTNNENPVGKAPIEMQGLFFFKFYGFTMLSSQSDLVIHVHTSILFQILFPYRLSQNIGKSSLNYPAGPLCQTSYTTVCMCQSQTPSPPHLQPVPLGKTITVGR